MIVFGLLFSFGFYAHSYLLSSKGAQLPFSLLKVYSFNALFSLILCYLLYLLSGFKNLKDQLGLIYLAALIVKSVLLFALFSPVFVEQETVSFPIRISLIIPHFLFLFVEVYLVAKILENIDTVKE